MKIICAWSQPLIFIWNIFTHQNLPAHIPVHGVRCVCSLFVCCIIYLRFKHVSTWPLAKNICKYKWAPR